MAIAFALLYLAHAATTADAFGAEKSLRAGWVTPLYFSTVTLATVGYGDLAPIKPFGQVLVVAEAAVGLLLIVVALQRVVGAITQDR
ncbi:MAG: two pore domain potassium channel family protein [Planctomycetia bacterium]|nr:two pore domain potassium channel family protein [Planctomycetia bacterium]